MSRNFEAVLKDNPTSQVRGQMLLGAHLAGMAIECSMLGAAHACANPLTAKYGITHGIAVALMLPHVIQYNSQTVNDLYQDLHPSSLHERIIELKTVAGLPEWLRSFEITREDLPELAKEAASQWTRKFNPRPVDEVELLKLYEAAYCEQRTGNSTAGGSRATRSSYRSHGAISPGI